MRAILSVAISLLSLVLLSSPSLAINLSQFQEISGFSTACTNAYNTPLNGCTESDFEDVQPCSKKCVAVLDKMTDIINTECKGTSAYPNTLIGMFFKGTGTTALCPPEPDSSGGSGGATGPQPTAIASTKKYKTTVLVSKTVLVPPKSSDTDHSTALAQVTTPGPSSSATEAASSSSITPAAATSHTAAVASRFASGTATPRSTSATSKSTSKSSTSKAAAATGSTAASSNNGGGGTPFDVSSDATRAKRMAAFMIPVLIGALVLV